MNNIVFGGGISGGNSESQSCMDGGVVRVDWQLLSLSP